MTVAAIQHLPLLRIEVDGGPISVALERMLEQVTVRQVLSAPAQCELAFLAAGEQPHAGVAPEPGALLRVSVDGEPIPLFEGQVTAVEHAYLPSRTRRTIVRAYDVLHRLRKRQPVRAHVDVTLVDLARELVSDLGISVAAPEPGPLWPRIVQYSQSDLDLLVELAQRCGLYFVLQGGTLRFLSLAGDGSVVPLMLGDTLLEARLELNGDRACRSVSAIAWDARQVQTYQSTADHPRVGRTADARVDIARLGGSGTRALADQSAAGAADLQSVALAELDECAASEVTFWGVASGDTRLSPGTRVEVGGVAPQFAGLHVLTSAVHTIDRRLGYVTEMSTEPPAARERAHAAFVTFGTVTRVDDPAGLGRVRAALPTFQNVESDWMGVVTPGAGAGKGFVMLPDAGDHVLVLFPQGDPAMGVVLGGLYGMTAPPDVGIESGAIARYTLLTPGRQRVQLDDSRKMLRIENSEGSYVEIAPARVVLHAATDLVLEAPGRTVTIQGKAVEFRKVE